MTLLLFKVYASLKLCYIAADVDGVTHDPQLDLDVAGAGAGAEVVVTGFAIYGPGIFPILFFYFFSRGLLAISSSN